VVDHTFDLFVDLGATEDQAHFPVVYTNAITGQASLDPDELGPDLTPLFDAVLHLPGPEIATGEAPQLLVANLDYDEYIGRVAVGRLRAGKLRAGQDVVIATPSTPPTKARIGELFVFQNLARVSVPEASAGDIVAVAGLGNVQIGETVTDPVNPAPLPPISVEEPTVRMAFMVNTSPLAGKEGEYVTSRVIRDRLYKELERNVALRVEPAETADAFLVSGRGELHLAILIETMRREGYELAVGRPEVIFKDVDGELQEPFEEVYIDVADEYVGPAVELLGSRRGLMLDMKVGAADGVTSMTYRVPTRGMLGLRSTMLTATKGTAVLHTLFGGYGPWAGDIASREAGSLVAFEAGLTTSHALNLAQERGPLFVGPREQVYPGQIVGRNTRPGDIAVNVCRKKELTNHRRSFAEEGIFLTPPIRFSLDDAIEFVADDELVEVTPASIRLRKRELDHEKRVKAAKRSAQPITA
jgi:GTP-binding protein